MKFPEEFRIPAPPKTEPSNPEDPATLLEAARESKNVAVEVQDRGAWNLATARKSGWRDLCRRQAIEVLLTVVAFGCWTTLCVFDLSGWPNTFDSDDVASPVLSLSVLAVSCTAFGTRHWCVSRILQQDPTGSLGQSKLQYQLLILLASQWLLLSGAIIWLVFHASSQRHPQVIAGIVAVMILLVLLLCSLVYMLVQRNWAKTGVEPPKEHPDVARISRASEDLSLASVDPEADLRRSVRSLQEWGEVATRSYSDISDNFVGHVMSGAGPLGRPSLRSCFPLKVRVDVETDDIDKHFSDEIEMRHRNSRKSVDFEKELHRSSRGRWRPLFPTFMASSMSNPPTPTMSRTSMLSLGSKGSMRRCTSIHSRFRFETEAEVEQCLEKEIKRHTLEVNAVLQRSSSPTPSLGSVPSVPSRQLSSKKVKSSCASSSSGLSDTSG